MLPKLSWIQIVGGSSLNAGDPLRPLAKWIIDVYDIAHGQTCLTLGTWSVAVGRIKQSVETSHEVPSNQWYSGYLNVATMYSYLTVSFLDSALFLCLPRALSASLKSREECIYLFPSLQLTQEN